MSPTKISVLLIEMTLIFTTCCMHTTNIIQSGATDFKLVTEATLLHRMKNTFNSDNYVNNLQKIGLTTVTIRIVGCINSQNNAQLNPDWFCEKRIFMKLELQYSAVLSPSFIKSSLIVTFPVNIINPVCRHLSTTSRETLCHPLNS